MGRKEQLTNCLNELKKNTDVLETTFENCGLQVIQQSWQMDPDPDYFTFRCFVEVTGDPKKIGDDWATIKVNLYDAAGQIMAYETTLIERELFTGYDTFQLVFDKEEWLKTVTKSRVYAVLGQSF